MCVLNCSKRVFPRVFNQNILQALIGFNRGLHENAKVRRSIGSLYRYTWLPSCQLNPSPACWQARARFYSDKLNGENVSTEDSTLKFQEQSANETDSDQGQKTLEDFNIDILVSLLRQENAVDICVIKVPKEIKYTDYFVVVSGSSTRHLRAMALYTIKVFKFMKRDSDSHVQIEGKDADDWMCIDFGGIVIHFMLPETREVYELEKLWTLRAFDEQLSNIPAETLPSDFIYGAEVK